MPYYDDKIFDLISLSLSDNVSALQCGKLEDNKENNPDMKKLTCLSFQKGPPVCQFIQADSTADTSRSY